MTDQTGAPGPPGDSWSRPDPAAGDPRPAPPAYGSPPTYGPPGWASGPAYGPPGHGQPPPPPAAAGWGGAVDWSLPRVPKPGIVALRPLGFLEILDGAIAAIRSHPGTMLGLSAAVVTVSTLLESVLTYGALRDFDVLLDTTSTNLELQEVTDGLAALAGSALVTFSLTFLAQLVLTGVLTTVVYRAVLGEQVPLSAAWGAARGRIPALLALFVLIVVTMGAGVVLVSVPAVVLTVAGAPGIVLGLAWIVTVLAVITVIIYVWVVLGVASPAVVLERRGVLQAWSRSRQLVHGSFWRVLGILLLSTLIVTGIALAISVPFTVVSTVAGGDDPLGVLPLTVNGVGSILGGTITSPFAAAVVVLLFVDLRIRREGLDIELARAAGLSRTGDTATPRAPGGPGAPGAPGAPPTPW